MSKWTNPGLITTLLALFLTLSCSSKQPEEIPERPIDAEVAAYGELELLNVTANPEIESLTFRGSFRNHFDQPVDGIRVVLRILQEQSDTSPEVARAQKILDTHLEPSEHVAFEITAKIKPSSLANIGLFLNGFAVRRGGEELPISPLWQ